MADPALELVTVFQRALSAAFGPEYAATDPAIRPSAHADYQANAALGLKGRLGKPPRDVAAAIVAKLDAHEMIDRAEIAGPGFVNVTLRSEYLSREIRTVAADPRLGVPAAERPEG